MSLDESLVYMAANAPQRRFSRFDSDSDSDSSLLVYVTQKPDSPSWYKGIVSKRTAQQTAEGGSFPALAPKARWRSSSDGWAMISASFSRELAIAWRENSRMVTILLRYGITLEALLRSWEQGWVSQCKGESSAGHILAFVCNWRFFCDIVTQFWRHWGWNGTDPKQYCWFDGDTLSPKTNWAYSIPTISDIIIPEIIGFCVHIMSFDVHACLRQCIRKRNLRKDCETMLCTLIETFLPWLGVV